MLVLIRKLHGHNVSPSTCIQLYLDEVQPNFLPVIFLFEQIVNCVKLNNLFNCICNTLLLAGCEG
jgi:hypothetical protein